MKRIEKFALYANRDDEGVYATYTTSEKIIDDNWKVINQSSESETLYAEEAEHFLTKYNLVKVDNKWIHIIKESYHSESEHELSDYEKKQIFKTSIFNWGWTKKKMKGSYCHRQLVLW